jgi:NADH dehydrogenase
VRERPVASFGARLGRAGSVPPVTPLPHVVVLGAGFGGLAAADVLARHSVRTTLVDAHYYNTFQPLLYQVATGGLSPGDVAYPIRSLLRRRPSLDFRCGAVRSIDFAGKELRFDDGEEPIGYDWLILATGAATNFYGVAGAPEHSHAIYTLDDALSVRSRVFAQLEDADAHGEQAGQLTVVVVGGGATGVETAGALAELRAMAFGRIYRSLDPAASRVVLVERQDHLLDAFAGTLRAYGAAELERRGVEVRLETAVEEVAADHVRLRDLRSDESTDLGCGLVIWAAGVGAGALLADLDPALVTRGRVRVDGSLAVPGVPGAFAIGDVAAAPGADGRPLPQLAQPAIQGGRHAAQQILRAIDGSPALPFHYRDKGIMATIGRRAAVAEVRLPLAKSQVVRLRGRLAWSAWLGLHIVTLLGGRNRAAVLLNWAWRYLAWKRGPRVIVGG